MTKTLFSRTAQKATLENVLLQFWVSICNFIARHIARKKTVLLGGISASPQNRLAEKLNKNSSMTRQQDGKTVSLSKKGHIHMRAHAHVHGAGLSEKSVFRLADARIVGLAVSS